MSAPPPSVFEFLDYRRFLAAWFGAKKARQPRYSHRAFARRAGQRSPSALRDVIQGRRNLTPAGLEGFLKAMDLDGPEARFFRSLVRLDQAETVAEKNAAWLDITANKRWRESRPIEGSGFRYLSTWYAPAIRELANRVDFVDDPAWVAAQLRPAIEPDQAAEALELLFEMDLLVREGERITHGGGSVVTPREAAGLAVHNYHRQMLQRAHDAVDSFEPDARHFLGVTVTVPPTLVPQLKQELDAMQERILELCAGTEEQADQVMQFNLNFFPLSTDGSP